MYLIKKLQFHHMHPQYEPNYSLDTFFVNTLTSGVSGVAELSLIRYTTLITRWDSSLTHSLTHLTHALSLYCSKEVLAQVLDLFSDLNTLFKLVDSKDVKVDGGLVCIYPLLLESHCIFISATFLFSKLVRTYLIFIIYLLPVLLSYYLLSLFYLSLFFFLFPFYL